MYETMLIILEQALVHFPLILGAYISISLMKTPDISIESAYVFGAILGSLAVPMVQNMQPLTGILIIIGASLFGGACVGVVSSLLTEKAHIPHLLSSILTIGIFHGITQLIAGVYVSLSGYTNLLAVYDTIPWHSEIPMLGIIFVLLSIIAIYFFNTKLGYSWAAFGVNPHFFQNYGISSGYVLVTGIIVSNALAGLSGYLYAQSNGFADISMGFGKLLLCVTTLILGKAIYKGLLSVFTPIAGVISYFTLQQLLVKCGFDLRYFTMVQALVIVAILIIEFRNTESLYTDQLGV